MPECFLVRRSPCRHQRRRLLRQSLRITVPHGSAGLRQSRSPRTCGGEAEVAVDCCKQTQPRLSHTRLPHVHASRSAAQHTHGDEWPTCLRVSGRVRGRATAGSRENAPLRPCSGAARPHRDFAPRGARKKNHRDRRAHIVGPDCSREAENQNIDRQSAIRSLCLGTRGYCSERIHASGITRCS